MSRSRFTREGLLLVCCAMLAAVGCPSPNNNNIPPNEDPPEGPVLVKDLGAAPIYINAGGAQYVDSQGRTWLADTNFNRGKAYQTTAAIENTIDDPIYQSERYNGSPNNPLIYSVLLTPGTYTVRLHFAEIFAGAAEVGKRVFDVRIENQPVLTNYDIFASAGFLTATEEAFEVNLVDGTLNISLHRKVENPKISGIEIVPGPLTEPVLDASPGSLNFGSVTLGESSSAQTVTLSNTGNADLEVGSVSIEGAHSADFSINAAASYSIAPGFDASFDVTFGPQGAGDRTANLVIPSNVLGTPTLIPLSGFGAALPQPTADVSPVAIDFGNVTVATTSGAQEVTISNIGNHVLEVTTVGISGTHASDFASDAAPSYSIAPSDSASFNVTFTPSDDGARSAQLTIDSNDPAGPSAVLLAGQGQALQPPTAVLGPAAQDFGTVQLGENSAAIAFTLSNTGEEALEVSAVGLSGAHAGDFSITAAAPFSIAPGDSVGFTATFSPTASGVRTANIVVNSNDPNSPTGASLSGTGAEPGPPEVELSQSTIAFGSVNILESSSPQTLIITNVGEETLEISAVSIGGANSGDFSTTAQPTYSILATESVNFDVTFTPTAQGARAASLTINSIDPAGPAVISLSGTGVEPEKATVTPSTHNFGSVEVDDASAAQAFAIQNVDTQAHSLTGVTLSGAAPGEFTLSNIPALPVSLNPSATAAVSVIFEPTAAGGATADLVLEFDNGAFSVVASLSGTGTSSVPVAFYRLNAGGSAYTDPQGNQWVSDAPYVNTGNTFSTTSAIANTELDPLYQSERWDPPSGSEMQYSLPIASGTYTVRLHFAEIYSGAASVGARVFDVLVEGQLFLDNFDIFATAGFLTATIQSTNVQVNDGTLNIQFIHGANNPKISAIEVLGEVAAAPQLDASPGTLNFGDVEIGATSAPQAVTMTNVGTATLQVSNVQITNATGAAFATNATPPYTLEPSESATFNVTLTPDSQGLRTASLSIVSNDPDSPDTVSLTGSGVASGAADITVAPSSIPFGTVELGSASSNVTVTLSNGDSVSHVLNAVQLGGAHSGDFQLSSVPALPATIPAGGDVTVNVAFAPTATGSRSGQLAFFLDNNSIEKLVSLSGTGQNATPPPSGEALYRINTGGPAYTDTTGNVWSADNYFNTGHTFVSAVPIAGTVDDTLYQSERWDPSSAPALIYSFPVANGVYNVRLHFAEIYSGAAQNGARVFDVLVEGQVVLDNYDIFATAGFATAVVETVTANVTDGALTVQFAHVSQNPKISAIEVLPAGGLEADPGQLEWGHVGIGATGDTKNVTLTNVGDTAVSVTHLAFNVGAGTAQDFRVTLGGTVYAGNSSDVSYAVNVPIAAGDSIVVPFQFLPTQASDNDVDVVFAGNFAPVTVRALGTGGEDTGHPFLHVVIVTDPYLVDYDNNGSEPVSLVGEFSHTHEIGHSLTAFEWTQNGVLFATGANVTHPFPLGDHTVTLTIYDDNSPPEVLSGSETFRVVAPNSVPGILAQYYTAGGAGGANAMLDAVPSNASFAESLEAFEVLERSGAIGGSPFSTFVMVQLKGRINIPSAGQYHFVANGGNETRVFVNGSLHTGQVALSQGLHDLEARYAVDGTSELPLTLTQSFNGGAQQPIDPASLTHDQTSMKPVINSMPTSGLEVGGAIINISGLGFFPADQVIVHWGSTNLSGAALTVSPNQITLTTPPGTGTIPVTVETPNGVSNSVDYTYNSSGPAPVQFTLSDLVNGLDNPTCGTMGPDGRLYVAEIDGSIFAYTFDENYQVTHTQTITTLQGVSNPNILGLAASPFEAPGVVKLYVAHSLLFANGGACFTGFSPYSGQVSVLTGPNFNSIQPLITGLPVSNHDHGINGLEFDNNGDLLIAVGGNTNAGIPHCNIGQLDESPLSGAMLRAKVSNVDFNGDVVYLEPFTCVENDDQVFGGNVHVAHGVDVDVFAPGLRNSLAFAYMTNGRIYATDNQANVGFGDLSTGPNTQIPIPQNYPDELLHIDFNRYYGAPNRNRGLTDERQNVFYAPSAATIPGQYDAPLATFLPSTNGIIEYRAQTFNNAMRGELIVQKWNGKTWRVALSPNGTATTSVNLLFNDFSVLNLVAAPGGAIFGIDYTSNKVMKAVPNDIGATGLTVYDIFPWRAPASGGHEFVISGANFGTLGNTTVKIGGVTATLTSVTSKQIKGIIPSNASPDGTLLDVLVTVGADSETLPAAFKYLRVPGSDSGAKAYMLVTPNNSGSTYTAGSFKLTNQSTNGRMITRMWLDIDDSLVPDSVFDPFGLAGDPVGKDFTHDGGNVGIIGHQWFKPHADGFDALEVTFNNFGPGKTLSFSADIDPTSIKGAAQPGPSDSGSIDGMELTNSYLRVEFNDGSILEGRLFWTGLDNTGGQVALLPRSQTPRKTLIEAQGLCSPAAVTNANQTITVYGQPGAGVRLLHVEAGLFLDGVPGGGFDIDPFEYNKALSVVQYTATIGGSGSVSIPVVLKKTTGVGGYNVFSAVQVDAQGNTGPTSQTVILKYN